MSGWTKSGGKPSCCHGCERRAPGCHNTKTCAAWAEKVARRQKEKEVREAQKPVTRKSWEERRRFGQ